MYSISGDPVDSFPSNYATTGLQNTDRLTFCVGVHILYFDLFKLAVIYFFTSTPALCIVLRENIYPFCVGLDRHLHTLALFSSFEGFHGVMSIAKLSLPEVASVWQSAP